MRAGGLLVEQFCVFLVNGATFTTVVFLWCSSCFGSNGLYRFLFSQELGAAIRRCGHRLLKEQCARLLMSKWFLFGDMI
ncbi:hypothetical protein B9J09_10240 [Xylella fastidiosa subsp. pauca]|nr:hypothetical protein B9J09_10240 [Xylella fastidiosa subsp. pauca]TNW22250.1 hypothetical protein EIP73_04215 [Xylella fastidiosa subsp. pauca]TNW26236.1 hypothetical protein EIP74_07820 [Xylella fastidiosa subsp. pauca]